MNTKFILLLAATLLVNTKTSPAITSAPNHPAQKIVTIVRPYIPSQPDELSFNDDGHEKSDSKHHVEKKHGHHEEDGKHEHHVSYGRFGRRQRMTYRMCKAAIILAYFGSFLFSFQAVIHMSITRFLIEIYQAVSSHLPF